jgi:hypothetical protein
MIRWRRKTDGSYAFDFSAFEKFVKFCMNLGIDRRIECFSMLPWVSGKFDVADIMATAEKSLLEITLQAVK